MTKFWTFLQAWVYSHEDEDEGATMVEYALLVVGIALVAMLGIAVLGPRLSGLFNNIANRL